MLPSGRYRARSPVLYSRAPGSALNGSARILGRQLRPVQIPRANPAPPMYNSPGTPTGTGCHKRPECTPAYSRSAGLSGRCESLRPAHKLTHVETRRRLRWPVEVVDFFNTPRSVPRRYDPPVPVGRAWLSAKIHGKIEPFPRNSLQNQNHQQICMDGEAGITAEWRTSCARARSILHHRDKPTSQRQSGKNNSYTARSKLIDVTEQGTCKERLS